MQKSLSNTIKDYALSIGFDLVGITTANPLPTEELRFKDWLDKGYAGKMDYLKRHLPKKGDPRSNLPEAKSILVLGLNYYTEDIPPQKDKELYGKISRYARGTDYHLLIQGKIKLLEVFIAQQSNRPTQSKSYVDTGPLFEKALAQRAGLGFIGKNTLLLNREFGSWFFLAELLLDIELDIDEPAEGSCGHCSRCVKACPTQALKGDYTIDASQCIGYLNVELKEEIPEDLRSKIGNWLFGCDICQEVCPYTRRAKPSTFFASSPLKTGYLNLIDLLKIQTEETFKTQFAQTPFPRTKRRGLLRNAAVVAGNSKNKTLIPALDHLVKIETDSLINDHASWALKQLAI